MEQNSLFDFFKGKSNKFITVVLIGVLLLIIVMPVKNKSSYNADSGVGTRDSKYGISADDSQTSANPYENSAAYYEDKLKNILEKSYGKGTMSVMVAMKNEEESKDFYGSQTCDSPLVDGVLIVADVKRDEAADIAFAVCALFKLPAHKVAVLIKK